MFKLLNRHKKGVSPVIAVVLLIALTVAAAAVIWALTSGILDDASSETIRLKSVTSATISGTGATNQIDLAIIVNADSASTISGVDVQGYTGEGTATYSPSAVLSVGDNAITITIPSDGTTDFTAGETTFLISWSFNSGGSTEILTVTTQVS